MDLTLHETYAKNAYAEICSNYHKRIDDWRIDGLEVHSDATYYPLAKDINNLLLDTKISLVDMRWIGEPDHVRIIYRGTRGHIIRDSEDLSLILLIEEEATYLDLLSRKIDSSATVSVIDSYYSSVPFCEIDGPLIKLEYSNEDCYRPRCVESQSVGPDFYFNIYRVTDEFIQIVGDLLPTIRGKARIDSHFNMATETQKTASNERRFKAIEKKLDLLITELV